MHRLFVRILIRLLVSASPIAPGASAQVEAAKLAATGPDLDRDPATGERVRIALILVSLNLPNALQRSHVPPHLSLLVGSRQAFVVCGRKLLPRGDLLLLADR